MVDQVIRQALTKGWTLDMIYLDERGRITQRQAKIFKVKQDTVLGWCLERNAFRRFKRQGILAAEKGEKRCGTWQQIVGRPSNDIAGTCGSLSKK
ncbi:hypothetical protein GXN76_08900 [Kroppenstedtia pulmonis]|uniref:WYL domain-containing protein n=1 Tax=Kroppenstedtia pulmonis TaxID=1380685 RepID=A0A7D3XIN3_9BACL|nr:hypothetical protein [Kroppenstedtia pulmonis]QKG84584.1 hypothetical protein GXN76_08900 [Kroppenstedtia pulmonis]